MNAQQTRWQELIDRLPRELAQQWHAARLALGISKALKLLEDTITHSLEMNYWEEQEMRSLTRRIDPIGPVTVITADGTGKAMLHEDDHLEMLHEDRYPEPDQD